jgi:hypothetical protein
MGTGTAVAGTRFGADCFLGASAFGVLTSAVRAATFGVLTGVRAATFFGAAFSGAAFFGAAFFTSALLLVLAAASRASTISAYFVLSETEIFIFFARALRSRTSIDSSSVFFISNPLQHELKTCLAFTSLYHKS